MIITIEETSINIIVSIVNKNGIVAFANLEPTNVIMSEETNTINIIVKPVK